MRARVCVHMRVRCATSRTHTRTRTRLQALAKDKLLKEQAEVMEKHTLNLASLAAERDLALEEVPIVRMLPMCRVACVSSCTCPLTLTATG